MANQPKQTCPYFCPVCAVYEAQEALREGVRGCLPPEVSSHLNRAGHELLLAVRAWLDSGLGALAQEPKPGTRRKAQKVKVE